jgi:KAP family P-loop domain
VPEPDHEPVVRNTGERLRHVNSGLGPGNRAAGAVPPRPEVARDFWTVEDALGNGVLAEAVAGFIAHPETSPPFTITVSGAPGVGKTSMMRMIRDRLDPIRDGARRLESGYPTVWFNAWLSQTQEEALAGLASAIVTQLTDRLPRRDRERMWLRLSLASVDPAALRARNRSWDRAIGAAFYAAAAWFLAAGLLVAAPPIADDAWVRGIAGVMIAAAGVALVLLSALSYTRSRDSAATPLAPPDYAQAGAAFRLYRDIRIVVDTVARSHRPLVVFVDDLDRCAPGAVAQVIEALSGFLAGEVADCVFVIAMDPDVVAARLEAAYGELLEGVDVDDSGWSTSGWRFLERTAQLPLSIPTPRQDELFALIEPAPGSAASSGALEQAVAMLRPAGDGAALTGVQTQGPDPKAAGGDAPIELGPDSTAQETPHDLIRYLSNPRHAKRFLNVFRFYFFIAYARRSRGFAAANTGQIAKFAVLTVRWPQLLGFLTRPHSGGHSNLAFLEALARRERDRVTGADPWRRELERASLPEGRRDALIADRDLRALLAQPHPSAT